MTTAQGGIRLPALQQKSSKKTAKSFAWSTVKQNGNLEDAI